jgi:hypothetical protein
MKRSTFDPTAAQRPHGIRAHFGASQPITDPTDPRYGEPLGETREGVSDTPRIVDPTDPEYGGPAD